MNKETYNILINCMTDSIRNEITRLRKDYPNLYQDVLEWRYQGKGVTDFEILRQKWQMQIREEIDANKKQLLQREATKQLQNAAKWFAFQFLFEEGSRQHLANEVTINMLRHGKFENKDIEEILPMMSQEKITAIKERLKKGVKEWEVITHG